MARLNADHKMSFLKEVTDSIEQIVENIIYEKNFLSENPMGEMRFRVLMDEISCKINAYTKDANRNGKEIFYPLFEEEEMNERAKIITETVSLDVGMPNCNGSNSSFRTTEKIAKVEDEVKEQYADPAKLKDTIIQMSRFFREDETEMRAYFYMFWSLLIAISDQDLGMAKKNELIDFFYMLKISAEEVMSLVFIQSALFHTDREQKQMMIEYASQLSSRGKILCEILFE